MAYRLFFATDVHGSEGCWRKFLSCAQFYGADVLVLGGDMTGKAVVPFVGVGSGRYQVHLRDQLHELEGSEQVTSMENLVRDQGYYPVRLTADEVREYSQHHEQLDAVYEREVRRRMEEWVALADERLSNTDTLCVVCPGNDDAFYIDDILGTSSRIEVGEGKVVELPEGYQMASSGWTNPTPWDTPREEDEPALKKRIQATVAQATVESDHLVLGLHAPPHDTQLDVAPRIDWETLTIQPQESVNAGSTAVREVIEEVQPILALHGHIHESRGAIRMGRTLCINPGSTYEEGQLNGCLLQLDGRKKIKNYRLTSG